MDILIYVLFFLAISGLPIFLTLVNLYNLFWKKPFIPVAADILIFSLGPFFTLFIYYLWSPENWQDPLYIGGNLFFDLHEPISEYTTILVLACIAIAGYALLRIKAFSLPPMVIVLGISAIYIGCTLSVVWILQWLPNLITTSDFSQIQGYLMCLFPLNFIISSIILIRRIMKETSALLEKRKYKNRLLAWCENATHKSNTFPLAAFILMWPLLGLCVIVLVLFGQKPDAMIKAFTETSDWLFSQKTSPPPIQVEDDYLCTAAAGGHKRVVKPLRMGERRGQPIMVNRQLCVANAFEELIQKKTPRFHKFLRRIYDVIGYAIAKRIKTSLAADIAYIIIKPLEWLLLLILYLVEIKPENKIARQYLPIDKQKQAALLFLKKK